MDGRDFNGNGNNNNGASSSSTATATTAATATATATACGFYIKEERRCRFHEKTKHATRRRMRRFHLIGFKIIKIYIYSWYGF